MSRATKIWMLAGAFLIIVGGIIFAGVMKLMNWDFSKLSTVKYVENSHEINEAYKDISILTDTADVVFVTAAGQDTRVECYENEKVQHSVSVKDGTLVIEARDTRKWYDHIGLFFKSPKITVTLPAKEYGVLSVKSSTGDVEIAEDFSFESVDVSENTGNVICRASASEYIRIKTDTGDITVEGLSSGKLDLSTSTGKVTVTDVTCEQDIKVSVSTGKTFFDGVTCEDLASDGSTGDLHLKDVKALCKFSLERSTGNIKFEGSDAAEIYAKTDTGSIKGTLLTGKMFSAKSDTGRVSVPDSTDGGKCELLTDTGNIKIEIE